MSVKVYPDLGRLWLPNSSISLPGRSVHQKPVNIVVASVRRPLWSIKGVLQLPDVERPQPDGMTVVRRLLEPFRGLIDPLLFASEVVFISVTHNERVDDGAGQNVNRIFGTVGASNGVGTAVAINNKSITAAAGHRSVDSASQGITTNEFTTIGLSRAAGTVQNYVAPAALNGTYSVDIYKSFSVSGGGTAYGSALFDQLVAAGSYLVCEDNWSSAAVVVNGDTVNNTWTYTN